MQQNEFATLAELRLLVGYLGERDSAAWWPGAFCSSTSTAFLSPAFPRTLATARYQALLLAAQRVHDQRVGLGEVYHLFRLPEDMEQFLHDMVRDAGEGDLPLPSTHQDAIERMEKLATSTSKRADGPVRIGKLEDVRARRTWVEAAGLYLNAFSTGHQVHPYLADR